MWNRSETSGASSTTAELAGSKLAETGQGSASRRVTERASRSVGGGATTVERVR